MFECLSDFKRIIVTGPQRSGTRIGAQIIAYDLEYQYIDEREVNIDSLYRVLESSGLKTAVVQAPGICRYAHVVARMPDTAIVMMRREINDIIASQERIGWTWEAVEQAYYEDIFGINVYQIPISKIKYAYWEIQKLLIENAYDLSYESLSEHELWVPKEQRKEFTSHQTSVTDA